MSDDDLLPSWINGGDDTGPRGRGGRADRSDRRRDDASADDAAGVDDGAGEVAFEVERGADEGWIAIAPLAGETFAPDGPSPAGAEPDLHAVGAPVAGLLWPDGPEVDRSEVPVADMTGLWLSAETGRESPLRIDGQPLDPRDAGIDDDLALRLLDYSDMWARDWDPATGWRPRARPDDFEALGGHLARRLKDALGATEVTLYLAHLGRSGVVVVPPAEEREPIRVRLMNEYGAPMPVWGDFVTEAGVGSFSSELNLKLEAWAEVFAENMHHETGWRRPEIVRAYRAQAYALAEQMRDELGPDYVVDVDLWELDGDGPGDDGR
ncbi:hypothetical protein [Agilicoccus flavus]|uniref:hypothetical protein n=1 Tax=Agilicoccus flavus TaxID=2775968 RepID=UPI001CF6117E|nr:hypothetical protein [Agilicoccus flavus]